MLGLFFDPEDGSDIFLRNVDWPSADCAELYCRRQKSAVNCLMSDWDKKECFPPDNIVVILSLQLSFNQASVIAE
jgi:hypothetical protein